LARELSDHAQEQDICSAEGAGKIGERLSDLFPFGGPLENPLAGFADPTSYLPFGAAGTASKEMFQRAWQVFAHGGEDAIEIGRASCRERGDAGVGPGTEEAEE